MSYSQSGFRWTGVRRPQTSVADANCLPLDRRGFFALFLVFESPRLCSEKFDLCSFLGRKY